MPELPEVETIRKDLNKKIAGKKIKSLEIKSKKTIKNSLSLFRKVLLGSRFEKIDRIGKLLIFEIEKSDYLLLVHLIMTGQLIYHQGKEIIAGGHSEKNDGVIIPDKHNRVNITFEDDSKLFFNDMRLFGYFKLIKKQELKEVKVRFGPEPFSKELNIDYLIDVFKKRKANIKAVLLDQKIVAGIGNIYADEILFLSGVRPTRLVNSLTKKEIEKIQKAINKIIDKALKYRGTTFNDYVDASGKTGNFEKMLKVYGRGEKKCKKCDKKLIKIKVAGRGTVYCPKCQK